MTETQEMYYNRKITECKGEAEVALKRGYKTVSAYYEKEASNYEEALRDYLKQEKQL